MLRKLHWRRRGHGLIECGLGHHMGDEALRVMAGVGKVETLSPVPQASTSKRQDKGMETAIRTKQVTVMAKSE